MASVIYPIDSYRAGGFCLQPFIDFKPFFESNNIINDFSVLKDLKNNNERITYNYLNLPKKCIYKFNTDVIIEDVFGAFTEFTISSIKHKKWLFTKLIDKYLYFTTFSTFFPVNIINHLVFNTFSATKWR